MSVSIGLYKSVQFVWESRRRTNKAVGRNPTVWTQADRTSSPSITSKGYPGNLTAHIVFDANNCRCSAGQHSERISSISNFLFHPSCSIVQVTIVMIWTGFPPSSKPPLLRVLQRACMDNSSRAPVSRDREQRQTDRDLDTCHRRAVRALLPGYTIFLS